MGSSADALKHSVAIAALGHIRPALHASSIIGIGTGSTTDLFIDALASCKGAFAATVASSERSAARLRSHGIRVLDLNDADVIPVYIDGADEITDRLEMVKGGGGALTREKIVAAASQNFVCIADGSKLVSMLGAFALPVEVIPMARRYVTEQLSTLLGPGAGIMLRKATDGSNFVTDNGNLILDVHGLHIAEPEALESSLDSIVGVVCNGLFAARGADVLILGTQNGVRTLHRPVVAGASPLVTMK